MKKTLKLIVMPLFAVAVCVALIAGSTFALFTSESNVNLAITSGSVSVSATVDELVGTSAVWDDASGEYVDQVMSGNSFLNKGTFGFDGNLLSLERITAGDAVSFKIKVTNNSNVAIKYQVVVTDSSDGDSTLFRELKINVGEDLKDISSDRSTAVSGWVSVPKDGEIADIPVSIRLPVESKAQDLTCKIIIGVYAVQGNGEDNTNQDVVYLVRDSEHLSDALTNVADNGFVALDSDMELSGSVSVDGKNATLDLNGHTLDIGAESELVADGGATLTLTGGTITVDEANKTLPWTQLIVARNSEGTTSTLNVDCTVNLDNVADDPGWGYCGIYAEGNDNVDEGGTAGSKAVINMTENAELQRSLSDGSVIALGSNATLNMNGGSIDITPAENSINSSNVASAVWLDEPTAEFNMSGGEINARGYNMSVINMYHGGTVNISGGTINVFGDTTVAGKDSGFYCVAIEVYETLSVVNFTGGTINVDSNIKPEWSNGLVCAVFTYLRNRTVIFAESATINVNKTSERNFSFCDYNDDKPLFDESGSGKLELNLIKTVEDTMTLTLEGTVNIIR